MTRRVVLQHRRSYSSDVFDLKEIRQLRFCKQRERWKTWSHTRIIYTCRYWKRVHERKIVKIKSLGLPVNFCGSPPLAVIVKTPQAETWTRIWECFHGTYHGNKRRDLGDRLKPPFREYFRLHTHAVDSCKIEYNLLYLSVLHVNWQCDIWVANLILLIIVSNTFQIHLA